MRSPSAKASLRLSRRRSAPRASTSHAAGRSQGAVTSSDHSWHGGEHGRRGLGFSSGQDRGENPDQGETVSAIPSIDMCRCNRGCCCVQQQSRENTANGFGERGTVTQSRFCRCDRRTINRGDTRARRWLSSRRAMGSLQHRDSAASVGLRGEAIVGAREATVGLQRRANNIQPREVAARSFSLRRFRSAGPRPREARHNDCLSTRNAVAMGRTAARVSPVGKSRCCCSNAKSTSGRARRAGAHSGRSSERLAPLNFYRG